MFRKELRDALVRIRDIGKAEGFLHNMFTDKEVDELAVRMQILKRIKKYVPQRDIAEELHTAIATVSRGAREVKYKKTKFLDSL